MVVWWSEPTDDESVSSSLRFAFRLWSRILSDDDSDIGDEDAMMP